MTPASRTTWQRATRFCSISYKKAPRDHGIVNDARSMARTSSRSPGRIGSTDRSGTTSKLRLRGSQIEGRDLGGSDAVTELKPLAPENGHARRRRHAPGRRQPSRLRRVYAGGSITDEQRRL